MPAYTVDELMACVMSREVRDGETVGVGAVSPIPAAGVLLAEQLHAPRANIIILESEDYNPFPSASEFHFLAQRGGLDLFFLSGIQFDAQGNFNLHLVGDYHAPRVRMAGAYGSAVLYYMARRVILFRTEHTRRTFVPRVDFVTAPGPSDLKVHRPGGPYKLVTPLAVLRFNYGERRWEVESVHPGVDREEVADNTGFPLAGLGEAGETPPPTPEELRALRTAVRERLMRIYPEFASTRLGPP